MQRHFSEGQDVEPMGQVQGQLDELKDIMVKNIGENALLCASAIVLVMFVRPRHADGVLPVYLHISVWLYSMLMLPRTN